MLVQRSNQETPFFLPVGAVRIEHVHDARCGRAHPARVYPQSRLSATGIKNLVSLDFTKPRYVTLRAKLALERHRPWLCAAGVTRLLIPVACRLVARAHARRDARVRGQQHGRAVRGQRPLREKQSFFGDFLPISKKLPAACGGSFCSPKPSRAKALDSRFRGNDEQ